LKQVVKDYEETVRINKDMLSLVLGDLKDMPEKPKKALELLNKENSKLLEDYKNSLKEVDDINAKMLIQQQIIEDMKSKEEEMINSNEENLKQL
jgi:hypothetical protein